MIQVVCLVHVAGSPFQAVGVLLGKLYLVRLDVRRCRVAVCLGRLGLLGALLI